MTHSQQPSIDILQKHIDFLYKNSVQGSKTKAIIQELEYVKKNIKALPQSPSVESLLEETKEEAILFLRIKGKYRVHFVTCNSDERVITKGYSRLKKTPILAFKDLLALKQKLNNNNQ